ncbi:MAG TPA: T9SS type A sorting domain-containing protein, partial [Chitinophagales bacterium]|nr:T9SS type A sorting domain-containing protein [Chitinophagales bacterium]
MKRIITGALMIAALLSSTNIFAQYCGNSGPLICIPSGGPQSGGFFPSDSIPCIVQGQTYSGNLQFYMFTTFDFQGHQNVDSIQFDVPDGGLGNLPCGICWSTNKASNTFAAGEQGCLHFTGTTNDAVGQYKLEINLNAWINGNTTAFPVSYDLVDMTGTRMWLRVVAPSTNCPAVDTSSGANNLTASTNCPTGISDVSSDLASLSINPNPVNSVSNVSFAVSEAATYTVRITDLTGKVISNRQISAHAGINTFTIQKADLANGVYFLTLNNGKVSVTHRF